MTIEGAIHVELPSKAAAVLAWRNTPNVLARFGERELVIVINLAGHLANAFALLEQVRSDSPYATA